MATSTSNQSGTSTARVLTIISFVCSAIALVFFPIVFGPVAIVLAAIALTKSDPLAKWALGVAIACTIGGFILGAVVISASS